MLIAEQFQMRLPNHVSHQNAAQFKIWPIMYEPSEEIPHASGAPSAGKAFN